MKKKKKDKEESIFFQIPTYIFVIIVFYGFIYQSYLTIDLYFGYFVSTKIKVEVPEIMRSKAVSFCTRWTDVMDYRAYNEMYGSNFFHSLTNTTQIQLLQHKLSVAEILKFTPGVDQVLDKVWFRQKDDYEVYEGEDKSFIRKHFQVSRYIYLEYICYKINRIIREKMESFSLSATPLSAGLIMMFRMNPRFETSYYIKLVLHGSRTYPKRSLPVTLVVNRHYEDPRANYNHFIIDQTILTTNFRSSPYETQCINYRDLGFEHETDCAFECIRRNTLKTFDKLPFSTIILENDKNTSDKNILSYKDASKRGNGKIIERIENDCFQKECYRPQCHFHTSIDHIEQKVENRLTIRYILPLKASITINNNPKYPLLEFLTNIMSIISTWTGMSVLHFNPVVGFKFLCRRIRIFLRKRKKRRELMKQSEISTRYPQNKWIVVGRGNSRK